MSDKSDIAAAWLVELDWAFHQNVQDILQYLERLRFSRSADKAELALECLNITLWSIDTNLSHHARTEFKCILVHDEFAMETILEVMNRKYSNAKFYRHALTCLLYFIRDSEEIAAQFLELGGLQFTVEIMQAFGKNDVIQWYGFDMFRKIVGICDGFEEGVVEKLVSSIIGAMLAMYDDDRHAYDKACCILVLFLRKMPHFRKVIANNVAHVSQALVGVFNEPWDPDVKKRILALNVGRIAVLHDIRDIALYE